MKKHRFQRKPKRLQLSAPKGTMILLGHSSQGSTYAVPSSESETGREVIAYDGTNINAQVEQQMLRRFPYLGSNK
jgi:hypothetical protein